MTRVPINEAKDRLTSLLKEAEEEEVLITRHGRPAGILIGFADEEDYFDYQLENDPRFEARIVRSREQKRRGDVIRLEDIEP
jgi:prevent-host-death family protein